MIRKKYNPQNVEQNTYSQLEMMGKTDFTEKTAFGFASLYKCNKKELPESRAQHILAFIRLKPTREM